MYNCIHAWLNFRHAPIKTPSAAWSYIQNMRESWIIILVSRRSLICGSSSARCRRRFHGDFLNARPSGGGGARRCVNSRFENSGNRLFCPKRSHPIPSKRCKWIRKLLILFASRRLELESEVLIYDRGERNLIKSWATLVENHKCFFPASKRIQQFSWRGCFSSWMYTGDVDGKPRE